jgi:hypothetical protein
VPQDHAALGEIPERDPPGKVGSVEFGSLFAHRGLLVKGTYPPNQIDFGPILRAIKATDPDLVFVASYPADTAGMLRAVEEQGLSAKMFGGPIVGLQYGSGLALERHRGLRFYVRERTMSFPGEFGPDGEWKEPSILTIQA